MIDRDELVARLREGTFGSDITKTDVYLNAICSAAADQIERDGREIERLTAENQRLRATLSAITATDCYSRDECTAMARAALSGEGET